MARPRKYTDPGFKESEIPSSVDLKTRIDEYFTECEKTGTFPDEAGMRVFLGISKDTVERYLSNEDGKYGGFAAVIKNARDKRESMLVRDIYQSGAKEATGKIFLSKQPTNGGLSDRQDNSGDGQINVHVAFGNIDGKDAENFGK